MWNVDDPQACLMMLHHVAARAGAEPAPEHHAADAAPLARLCKLSASDLHTLAAMRRPLIRVALDDHGLRAALRALQLKTEVQALETYFIRHGASPQMMHALFSLTFKNTYQRRREYGVPQPRSRVLPPPVADCERIRRTWRTLGELPARLAYYRLHQAYPELSMAVLEAVVREVRA